MLGPFFEGELRQKQLDYWFGGEGGPLPGGPSERVHFLLSTGLTEATGPHMLRLLAAALCHPAGPAAEVPPPASPGPNAAAAAAAAAAAPRPTFRGALEAISLAGASSLVVGTLRGPLGSGGPPEGPSGGPSGVPWGGSSGGPWGAPWGLGTGRLGGEGNSSWGGAFEGLSAVPVSPFSLKAAAAVSLLGGASAAAAAAAADPRATASVGPEGGPQGPPTWLGSSSILGPFKGTGPGGPRGAPMSRAAAVALQERRSRRAAGLLQQQLEALEGREDIVLLQRPYWGPGGPRGPGGPTGPLGAPGRTVRLLGAACELSQAFAREFLLLLLLPGVAPGGVLPRGPLRGPPDPLGLAAAGRMALERSLRGPRGDPQLVGFLMRLVLQALEQQQTWQQHIGQQQNLQQQTWGGPPAQMQTQGLGPLELFELAEATETVEAALPLLQQLTCMQQSWLLLHYGGPPPQGGPRGAPSSVSRGLLPYFSALLRVYRHLGQSNSFKCCLQLLALHRCVDTDTAAALLQLWGGGPPVGGPPGGPPKSPQWLQEAPEAAAAGSQETADAADPGALRPLLREGQLLLLQRMMQWKPLLDFGSVALRSGPSQSDTSSSSSSSSSGLAAVDAAREEALLQQTAETGSGCLLRAALALNLGAQDAAAAAAAAAFLSKLARHVCCSVSSG
ncbi:hypothetical protein, conserved, partial [Eimeria tenella]